MLHRRMVRMGTLMILVLVVVALGAPWIAPHDPIRAAADSFGDPFTPQLRYLCGTDELGRDVLSRLLYGAQISLLVAVLATGLAVLIGVGIGAIAGFAG